MMRGVLLAFVPGIMLIVPMTLKSEPAPEGGSIDIKGDIWNGTIDGPQRVDRISLILPQNVNEVIATLENVDSKFLFENVRMSTGPLLIRAEYRGELFTKLISSSRATGAQRQRVIVYEPGAPDESIRITMMTQIIRRKKRLQVAEIYSVSNTSHPPRVFHIDAFPLHISGSQSEPRVQVQNETTGFPESIIPTREGMGYSFEYGFKPGVTGISVEYEIPGDEVSFDNVFIISSSGKKIAAGPRILLWQPTGSTPEVIGGRRSRITVPEIGEALSIDHEGGPITVRMSPGPYIISDPSEAQYNPIFDGAFSTLAGLFGFLTAMVAILYFSSKIRSNPASGRKR
jgi:hypothetical protein